MKIAVLREAGGLGDVVATEPAVRGLKEQYPGAEIWYACLPEYGELVAGWPMPPDVYLAVERRERRDRDAAPDGARRPYLSAFRDFDRVVDLFCPAFQYERARAHRTDKSRVRLFCEAAGVRVSAPEQTVTEAREHWAGGWLAGRGVRADRPLVGLQPVSCGARRNWPIERWAELSRGLEKIGVEVLVFHTFARAVRSVRGLKAAGLRLGELAALAARCDLLVTPDSGLLHLASALGIPTLSLWGSTNPHATCELYPRAEAIWPRESAARPRACRAPCYSLRGSLAPECRAKGCLLLRSIRPEEVLARARGMLESSGRPRARAR
ncbi:MAG: glycosyltransferase family 9 protein [Planctomycetota bacterium]